MKISPAYPAVRGAASMHAHSHHLGPETTLRFSGAMLGLLANKALIGEPWTAEDAREAKKLIAEIALQSVTLRSTKEHAT